MTLLWFLSGGLQDVSGLVRRILFTILFLPVGVFLVGFMYAIGKEKQKGTF